MNFKLIPEEYVGICREQVKGRVFQVEEKEEMKKNDARKTLIYSNN